MIETKEQELDPALHDLEQALASRRWEAQCLRTNIVQPDKIFTYPSGNMKVALCESNTPRKNEQRLRELIQNCAPEWWGDDTTLTLNRNVQCKRHRDGNHGLSWILWLGDFTGGALVFEDGKRIEEKYKWHQIEGRTYHWNEPHEGTKYAIIMYKASGKQTKSSHMLNKRWPKNSVENISSYTI